jgi:hypothetical protein
MKYYTMLHDMLFLKLQGQKTFHIKQLQEFKSHRALLYTNRFVHCAIWARWFVVHFQTLITFENFIHVNFLKVLEKHTRKVVLVKSEESLRKSNFTFLCCINNMVYKDIRRLLFEYVCNVQARHFDCNIKEMDKFIKRNCSTYEENLWVIEKNGNYKSFTLL